jgi:hypothetical protein
MIIERPTLVFSSTMLRRKKPRRGGTGGSALSAPVLVWDGETDDATPDFSVTLTSPLEGDVVTLNLYSDSGLTTLVDTAAHTLDATDISNGTIAIAIGSQVDGTYYAQIIHSRTGATSGASNTETVTVSTGSLAPMFLLLSA